MNKFFSSHYEILGVTRGSDSAQIKDAFRKLSKIHHPDKNQNSKESNLKYRIILNAYEILMDDRKRNEYDSYLKKSEYLKKYGKTDQVFLSGKAGFGNEDILKRINITLWDILFILEKKEPDKETGKILLIMLTFLDRWILGPCGFPDYFMEARELESRDPRELIRILGMNSQYRGYSQYNSISDYYYDIRKRTDKFLTRYEKQRSLEEPSVQETSLVDRIIEYNDMAVHYLNYLFDYKEGNSIPLYEFSNAVYDY